MNIYTHTPDGNEPDNNVLPEGSIGVRSNQLVIGNGTDTMSELDPVAGPEYGQGGSTSFVIASAEVDLSVAGTTELTYASGVNGLNNFPLFYTIEAANGTDTYTEDAGQSNFDLQFDSKSLLPESFENNTTLSTVGIPVYGTKRILGSFTFTSSMGSNHYLSECTELSKYEFVVGATPPSTTQFRVTVKILGIKTA